jgi:glutathione peroxidase
MRMRTGWIVAGGLLALAGGALIAAPKFLTPATPPLAGAASKRLGDFDLVAIDGAPLPMKRFAGQVVLLVNTASFCGYTPQYDGLQALQTRYAAQGFTVIGVPSGNFLGQEYGSNKEISTFCQAKFGIKFPLAEKSDVVGRNALPVYRWAAAVLGANNRPTWNFHKYLIGRDGRLIAAFGTKIAPNDASIRIAIERALSSARAKA